MSTRFIPPAPGRSTSIAFPPTAVETLSNGLAVRVIPMSTVPAVTVMLAVLRGTGNDPVHQPGLASLTGDLLDEGAGARDAIGVADAFVRLGAQLTIDVGPDVTSISVGALSRSLDAVFDLLADLVRRPHLAEPDFARVRELRLNRLRQLSRSAGTGADRIFVNSVFRGHPYGHGSLGTTAALEAFTPDDPRRFWSDMYAPELATLIVGGAIDAAEVIQAARRAFGGWTVGPGKGAPMSAAVPPPDPRFLVVNRP
jgi:zinc protease